MARTAGMVIESITFPTIHLNGSDVDDLIDQYRNFRIALKEAIDKMPIPHGRDYYPQGDDAYKRARSEAETRMESLNKILSDINTICVNLHNQKSLRKKRR